ncbi:hypothetical protein LTR99_005396 [Exophiala xenobiotica]|uniref:Ankyrin repeat protein n=1 Tax=Vermiconidia calcicola TaxID=1690605 RepID=A0AAV9Q7T2_9PEZI|nr:hypothetical protein LTR99_005396 [Exophiala xenobiotica]KAK5436736.1 hypothetical protein LTR34_002367 [Exophiala xenobiotica]KAK5535844.1 hypothetical protein LTR25_005746 [Vermiconidia calcicola]KAK5548784.1 hypothetical protein LTR23_001273 [Chaetothyriales sp. CCFEE 6169]
MAGDANLLATSLGILLSAGYSPDSALMRRTKVRRCACRPLHATEYAELIQVLLNHRADPDSLDEQGHTPLDKLVVILDYLETEVAAGAHLTRDGYKDFLRGRKCWMRWMCRIRDSEITPGSVPTADNLKEGIAKFVALMETVPVLQKRPTRRQLKAMYPKSTPSSTHMNVDIMSTYADLDSSSDESSKPKSSRLQIFFRRLKE